MAQEKKSTDSHRVIGASKSPTGHWRCGFFWPARLVWADVTTEQLALIKGDGRLICAEGQLIVETGAEDIPSALTLMAENRRKIDENRALAEAAVRRNSKQA
jgi:hypothetical protein